MSDSDEKEINIIVWAHIGQFAYKIRVTLNYVGNACDADDLVNGLRW